MENNQDFTQNELEIKKYAQEEYEKVSGEIGTFMEIKLNEDTFSKTELLGIIKPISDDHRRSLDDVEGSFNFMREISNAKHW